MSEDTNQTSGASLGNCLANVFKAANELAAWGHSAMKAIEDACHERDVAQRALAQFRAEQESGAFTRAAADAIGMLATAQQEAYEASCRALQAENKLADLERRLDKSLALESTLGDGDPGRTSWAQVVALAGGYGYGPGEVLSAIERMKAADDSDDQKQEREDC